MNRMTTKGLALLGKQQAGLAQPIITKVMAGGGYTEPAELAGLTALPSPIAPMEIVDRGLVDGKTVKLRAQLSNLALTETALIRQVGVFARDPDEGEILYQIVQYADPVALQPHTQNAGGVILFDPEIDLLFENGEAVSVPFTPGFLVTGDRLEEELEVLRAENEALREELANKTDKSGDTVSGEWSLNGPKVSWERGNDVEIINRLTGDDANGWSLSWLKSTNIDSDSLLTIEPFTGYTIIGGNLNPRTNGAYDIGMPGFRWKDIYATNGTINTSDERQKKDISPLDKAKDFFMALRPVKFRFKDGTSGRHHHGLIAQEVEEAMLANGLTDMDFAGLIKSPDPENEGEYIYGLRYSEFIPMLIKMVQDQQKEIDHLKAR